jgi:hypothetical protein
MSLVQSEVGEMGLVETALDESRRYRLQIRVESFESLLGSFAIKTGEKKLGTEARTDKRYEGRPGLPDFSLNNIPKCEK